MNISPQKSEVWDLPNPIDLNLLNGIDLPDCIKATLIRRGFTKKNETLELLFPNKAPDPYEHFPDLKKAIK